jgi:hypothetical protein
MKLDSVDAGDYSNREIGSRAETLKFQTSKAGLFDFNAFPE